MPLSQVLSVRKSPEAKDYFRKWSEWRKSSSRPNEKALRDGLSNYADRLRKDYLKVVRERAIQAVRIGLPEARSRVKSYWLDTAWKAVGQIPVVGHAIFLVEQGWAGMKIYNPDRAELLKNAALRSKSKRLKLSLQSMNTTSVNTQIVKKT